MFPTKPSGTLHNQRPSVAIDWGSSWISEAMVFALPPWSRETWIWLQGHLDLATKKATKKRIQTDIIIYIHVYCIHTNTKKKEKTHIVCNTWCLWWSCLDSTNCFQNSYWPVASRIRHAETRCQQVLQRLFGLVPVDQWWFSWYFGGNKLHFASQKALYCFSIL